MKKMRLRILAVLLVLAVPGFCRALTLDEAVHQALGNSHDLKQLRLESESARWDRLKALSGYLPKLQLEGRHLFNERFEELEVPFGGSVFVMPAIQPYTSAGLTATWNLFDGFQTSNNVQAASFKQDAARFRLERALEQKRAEIRALFYRALGLQVLVSVADQNIQNLESHLTEVNSRLRNGVSTKFDALRVEVQLEDARTEKAAAQNQVVIARARLFEALDTADDGSPLAGQLPDDFSRISVDKVQLQNEARTDRSALIAERDESMKRANASRSHWLPRLSVFGNYEWYNNINHSITESDERFKSAYAVGVLVQWNLFDGGSSYAEQRQAALANAIAQEKLARLERSMPVNLEEAKRRLSYDVLNYRAKLSSIKKAEEAVRLARGGVRAGTRTNTEVLDAVVDLNRAKAAAVKSQIDAIEALGQLELSVGHSL